MKRIYKFLSLIFIVSLSGCNSHPRSIIPDEIPDDCTFIKDKIEVAYVGDIPILKDKSYCENSYNGVKVFCFNRELPYKYYLPPDSLSLEGRKACFDQAIRDGAKVIVASGFDQTEIIADSAIEHPDVKYVFIDGGIYTLPNVASLTFKEEESGFMAGYALVKEGYKTLGFVGGGNGVNPSVNRYEYGYIQGITEAAKELDTKINLRRAYYDGFVGSEKLTNDCKDWYRDGIEIIFSCGGTMVDSVKEACESFTDKYLVGVDCDQSYLSSRVVTSAFKDIKTAVIWGLNQIYDNKFSTITQKTVNLGFIELATGLPTESWRFKNFTIDEYKLEIGKVTKNQLKIDTDYIHMLIDTKYINII